MAFLHGVETFEFMTGPVPVSEVKSAVIGLVGSAPNGVPGDMYVIRNRDDALATFGNGGTLPAAFDGIFDHINVTILAINAGTNAADVDIIAAIPTFESALSQFGFFPKILISPNFSHNVGVGAQLVATAGKIRAVAIVDAPAGLSPTEAVNFKGNFGSERAIVTYPNIKITDMTTGLDTLEPLSARLAGLIAKTDKEDGYWHSPSNKGLEGVTGVELVLDYIPNNENTALNYINSQGLVSVLNFLGSGYRAFGNRTAAFPFQSDPMTFIPWRRTGDIIEESIEYFTMQFLDKPMFTRPEDAALGLLNRVQDSVNGFIDSLKARGALVSGRCFIRADDNPTTELAAGHLTYTYEFTPPVPGERITYRAVVDVAALSAVFAKLIGG